MRTLLTGCFSYDEEIFLMVFIGCGWRELFFYLVETLCIWIRSRYSILLRCRVFVCCRHAKLICQLSKRHRVRNYFLCLLLRFLWFELLNRSREWVLLGDSFSSLSQETCHDIVRLLLLWMMVFWDSMQLFIEVDHISELLNCLVVFAKRIRPSHWWESMLSYPNNGILFITVLWTI